MRIQDNNTCCSEPLKEDAVTEFPSTFWWNSTKTKPSKPTTMAMMMMMRCICNPIDLATNQLSKCNECEEEGERPTWCEKNSHLVQCCCLIARVSLCMLRNRLRRMLNSSFARPPIERNSTENTSDWHNWHNWHILIYFLFILKINNESTSAIMSEYEKDLFSYIEENNKASKSSLLHTQTHASNRVSENHAQ